MSDPPSAVNKKPSSSLAQRFSVHSHNLEDERHTYTYQALQRKYPKKHKVFEPTKKTLLVRFWHRLIKTFPIIWVFKSYHRSSMINDFIAGLSVGFLHMPQSLAYSVLATLPLASGLYTSIFPIAIYTIFGTSVYTSMGTNSIVSILTADMVERELQKEMARDDTEWTSQMRDEFKIGVAMSSAMLCGAILLLMGVFRLGFLTSFFPTSFVGGYTTAAGVVIVSTQVGKAFNIYVPPFSGIGKLFKIYHHIFTHMKEANAADIVTNIITFAVLIAFAFINPKLKPKIKINFPANLLVVISGTALSYIFRGKIDFGLQVVGPIPEGFYPPILPNLDKLTSIIQDSLAMALITFTLNISMAIMLGKIRHQVVKPDRELVAYGMCNLLSFPFHCHISSVSPTRCMILNNDDAKTTLHSIPTCIFLLFVILKLGHLFEDLPVAVLAAVVFMAVSGLLAQGRQLPKLWRVNRTDFYVWVVTFLSTACLDLIYGLIIGVVMAALGILINNQRATGTLMVKATKENVFLHGDNRQGVQHINNIRIFHFPTQLCYFNAETFKKGLFKKVFDPTKQRDLGYQVLDEEDEMYLEDTDFNIRCIILECSAISYIDIDGINMLKMVVLQFQQAGVQVLMARVQENVYNALDKDQFFEILPRSCVFYELRDAVHEEWQTQDGISKISLNILSGKSRTIHHAEVGSRTSTVIR